MFSRCRFFTLLRVLLVGFILYVGQQNAATVHADNANDGIPGNCERPNAAYYQVNVFPRYEPQNSRVVLVNWVTGEDVRELEVHLTASQFTLRGWSPDCRYIVGALGNADASDTVVWDAVNGGRVAQTENAVRRFHSYRWSPDSTMLVVETRHGALLWNLITQTQHLLTTAWDDYNVRSFSSFFWDVKHGWLNATAVDGSRVVVDLTTGQPVTNYEDILRQERGITVVGPQEACDHDRSYNYSDSYRLHYDENSSQIVLAGFGSAVWQILDQNITTPEFKVQGWSGTCRFIVASIQRPELLNRRTKVYDTVVYDVVAQRRVYTFEDARTIPHPVRFHPEQDLAVIETRHGAYLWDLPTDTRTLMTDVVQAYSTYRTEVVRSFSQFEWDLERAQILTVTVENPGAMTAYNLAGQEVAFAPLENAGSDPIHFVRLVNGNKVLLMNEDGNYTESPVRLALWDQNSGVTLQFGTVSPDDGNWSRYLSPDERYLLIAATHYEYLPPSEAHLRGGNVYNNQFYVWDLQNLTPDLHPNYVSGVPTFRNVWRNVRFASPTVLQDNDRRWDILTGEMLYEPASYAAAPVVVPDGLSGMGISGYSTSKSGVYDCSVANPPHNLYVHHDGQQLAFKDKSTHEIVHVIAGNAENQAEGVSWSPNCRYATVDLGYKTVSTRDIQVWDALTLQPVTLSTPFTSFSFYSWSPQGSQALVLITYYDGTTSRWQAPHLWDLASGTLFRLQAEDFPIFSGYRSTHDVYWDYSRGQVLVATHYGFDVFAFDLATGNLRNRYRGSSAYTNYYSSIETSTGRHLRGRGTFEVFGSWMYIRGNNSLTLFNLDTGENQQVWVADESISVDQVAVSPDGRYLVVGGDTLRVWDLHNLPSSVESRTPQRYNGPEGSIVALHFLDTTTLEVRTVGDHISQWNVTTGLPS